MNKVIIIAIIIVAAIGIGIAVSSSTTTENEEIQGQLEENIEAESVPLEPVPPAPSGKQITIELEESVGLKANP